MKKIRESKITKFLAYYFSINIIVQVLEPTKIYALTTGPAQPEFTAFTPIGTSDMVDLASGDFNYNIPIMDVGGYPINLAYNDGVTMEQEASWVGLGWNLNVGQISRTMRGIPDDFDGSKGDYIMYENNVKPNKTFGAGAGVQLSLVGLGESNESKIKVSADVNMKYNNYNGFMMTLGSGLSADIGNNVSVGVSMQSSVSEGVSTSANISLHGKNTKENENNNKLTGNIGVTYNNRKGLENLNFGVSCIKEYKNKNKEDRKRGFDASSSISFANTGFTPTKRVAMETSHQMYNANVGTSVYYTDPSFKALGFGTIQKIAEYEKRVRERAFGYENIKKSTSNDILDYNREKESTINRNSNSIFQTVQTYDLYSIEAQGVSGTFRPYKGTVSYVHPNAKTDISTSLDLGVEIGGATSIHVGVNTTAAKTESSTKLWAHENNAIGRFDKNKIGQNPLFEETYFKTIGGNHVNKNLNINSKFYDATNLNLSGGQFHRSLMPLYSSEPNGGQTTNEERVSRNQTIQKLTKAEMLAYKLKIGLTNKYAKKHHTSAYKIIEPGGAQYYFANPVYNIDKRETTFDVTDNPIDEFGYVTYNNGDNSVNNNRKGDQYFNRVTTSPYAHTYLLSAVLSPDFQDLKGDGPTEDDLGNYTIFKYTGKKLYQWRFPYNEKRASFNEGLKAHPHDNKGSYTYGVKEIKYINKIITKTHVAVFTLSKRKDAFGVKDENGGYDEKLSAPMYKIDQISLYSKPEYDELGENAIPIKTAHFVYDYSLCKGIFNNNKSNVLTPNEIDNQYGKLTLKKVYFTYKDSKMGKYTPYEFSYTNNMNYNPNGFDSWGNYKIPSNNVNTEDVDGQLTNAEFPFTDQGNKTLADANAIAWKMNKVQLPSGGEINISYESDDYAYVQDKEAMQMVTIHGFSDEFNKIGDNEIYKLFNHREYVTIKRPVGFTGDAEEFKNTFLKGMENEDIYFRCLVNMSENKRFYDYVTGFMNLDTNNVIDLGDYFNIKMTLVDKGDGATKYLKVNPVAKAGWGFGNAYLPKLIYSPTSSMENKDLKSILTEIIGAAPNMINVLVSPNTQLTNLGIASDFKIDKGWLRLKNPYGIKYGGGSRVKKIEMSDSWDIMTGHVETSVPDNEKKYNQKYGQEYEYKLENSEKSSGVASYEPVGNKENPFVKPFYNGDKSYLLGPQEQNYTEMPFCETFFPSPKITYSRVSVKNLERIKTKDDIVYKVNSNATGKVVTHFYTTKDFPTQVSYTPLIKDNTAFYDKTLLGGMMQLTTRDYITLTQGFAVHTNDMDGKMKAQYVYAENQDQPISGIEYKYKIRNNKLDNNVTTIDAEGKVIAKVVGVDYDLTNDFTTDESITTTPGLRFNTDSATFGPIIIPVPMPLPIYNQNIIKLNVASTTKSIHSCGILEETIAIEDGSRVSTKNLAWDAETGNVILTETINEYNDKYYSFNFPAYWYYKNMSQSAKNIGFECVINQFSNEAAYKLANNLDPRKFLTVGDEVWIKQSNPTFNEDGLVPNFKAWVADIDGFKIKLIDKYGLLVDENSIGYNGYDPSSGEPPTNIQLNNLATLKVIKSGFDNQEMDLMATVTSLTNPLLIQGTSNGMVSNININGVLYEQSNPNKYKIINASAIEYEDFWASQCECYLPETKIVNNKPVFEYEIPSVSSEPQIVKRMRSYNPYLYNIKGNWRPKKSFAYLTGRKHSNDPTPRLAGFFNHFYPYYILTNFGWKIQPDESKKNRWTFASEISKYSPYGNEIENRDALNRFSSSIYGYNLKLPIAVASNAKYREIAFDGFEDYANYAVKDSTKHICKDKAHFSFKLNKDTKLNKQHVHSGKYSIRVAPKGKVAAIRKVSNCNN